MQYVAGFYRVSWDFAVPKPSLSSFDGVVDSFHSFMFFFHWRFFGPTSILFIISPAKIVVRALALCDIGIRSGIHVIEDFPTDKRNWDVCIKHMLELDVFIPLSIGCHPIKSLTTIPKCWIA